MSRRQTLAGLSPSQLNAKAGGNNGAPGRAAKESSVLPAKARKSVAPGLIVERPSAIGLGLDGRPSGLGAKPSGPKQDPRPLNSKEYQGNCIRKIIAYLSTHNFPLAVSPKMLGSPTGKDFSTIVTFLLQQVDPTFRIQGKVEDEVPAIFKRLNYPFQISKSALFAVGSPHSWPAVLAALTWLVELLEYIEKADDGGGSSFEQENKDEQDFLEYLAANYSAFMSGEDERCQELDDELVAKFEARRGDRDQQIEKLRQQNAEVMAELEQVRALGDPVVAAQETRDEKITDLQKFEHLIVGLQNMKQNLIRKKSEKTSEVSALQEQVTAAIAEAEQLRQRVASQTINKADVNRLMMERKKQNEMLESEKVKCEETERKVHEQEVQIVRCLTSLDSLVERYNKLANRLKLIPASSKRADGTNYELRINRDASSQGEFANLDLKGAIKTGLERLCATYSKRASEISQDLISLKETHVVRAERNGEEQEQNKKLQEEIARREAQLQAAKDAYEEKHRRLVAQAEGIKAQIDNHQHAASNRTEHMEERLSQAQVAFEQTRRDCDAELARVDADLKTALKLLAEHKAVMSNTIMQVQATVQHIKADLVASSAMEPFHHALT